jgi:hypothetical protein
LPHLINPAGDLTATSETETNTFKHWLYQSRQLSDHCLIHNGIR